MGKLITLLRINKEKNEVYINDGLLLDRNIFIDELDRKIQLLANYFIYITLLIIPVVIGRYEEDIFTLPKVYVLWSITILLLAIYLIDGKFLISTETKVITIFLILVLISTVISFEPITSFWGKDGRSEGLLTFISYGVLFIMTSKYLELNYKLLTLFTGLGALMGVYGVIQFYKLDELTNYLMIPGQGIGLIGNRNFFGTYMIIILSISISVYIFFKNKLYLLFSCMAFAGLLSTTTRGCWLTLIAFCGIGMIFILKRRDAFIRAIIIVILFGTIFGVMNVCSGGQLLDRANSIKNEISEINERSGTGRVYIWKVSGKVIKKYPFFGCGPDVLDMSIRKDFTEDLKIWRRDYEPTFIDKSHNEFINIAATLGIPALIVYCILLFLCIKKIIKNIKDDKFKILFIVISGYLIQAMFNISVVGVAPIFWTILGIASNPKIIKEINLSK